MRISAHAHSPREQNELGNVPVPICFVQTVCASSGLAVVEALERKSAIRLPPGKPGQPRLNAEE